MGKPFVDALDAGRHDLSSVKFLNNGAAPMSDDTKHRLQAHIPGLIILDGLGSSESGNLAARAQGDTFTLDAGGLLLAEDFSRQLSPDDDEVGWLCTATRHARGYLGDRTKTEATFVDYHGQSLVISGDRARYRPDGSIELLGRDSMTINTGGEEVFRRRGRSKSPFAASPVSWTRSSSAAPTNGGVTKSSLSSSSHRRPHLRRRAARHCLARTRPIQAPPSSIERR